MSLLQRHLQKLQYDLGGPSDVWFVFHLNLRTVMFLYGTYLPRPVPPFNKGLQVVSSLFPDVIQVNHMTILFTIGSEGLSYYCFGLW